MITPNDDRPVSADDLLEPCFLCEKPKCDIYIRAKIFGVRRTVAICDEHWFKYHPGQEPVRVKVPKFD